MKQSLSKNFYEPLCLDQSFFTCLSLSCSSTFSSSLVTDITITQDSNIVFFHQMYPIIGDRYRCKDCLERIGFDLCGDCYNTSSKLPGRFNQQHTAEHRFELKCTNIIHGEVRLEDDSVALLMAHMSGSLEEYARNREVPHATSANSEDEDEQDGSQPSSLLNDI